MIKWHLRKEIEKENRLYPYFMDVLAFREKAKEKRNISYEHFAKKWIDFEESEEFYKGVKI